MRILVAMSGGVDSSVAALLLKKAGHEVIGMTLRVHDDPEKVARQKSCCAPQDVLDAREVALSLDIPYYALDMREEFRRDVMEPFAKDYLEGRTPNPCVKCNSLLKFGALFERARALGFEQVATGHYARNHGQDLRRGRDADKDQSYFLFGLTREQLAHAIFPLGDLTKQEVRTLAREAGIATADKVESQEICFVPDGDYAKVVAATLPEQVQAADRRGALVLQDGTKLGEHAGIEHFTIGQRRGLGVSHPRPLYVLGIEPEKKRVTVGPESDLYRSSCDVHSVNWITQEYLEEGRIPETCEVAIRYRHKPGRATLSPAGPNKVHVVFDEPQRAVTPGQAAVFYQADRVLGGGWIGA